jgi:transcription-repair coupling factor (superfamily II helicase)
MKIALRDLEIRGAGNILGAEQHGYIQAVGFDLYCRLLEQETGRLKGEQVQENRVDPQLDIDIDYYIPESYIPDSGSKMRIYRRLLLAGSQEEVEEIREEIRDRFGPLPQAVENFLQIAALRLLARDKEIKSLRRKGRQIEIQTLQRLPGNLSEHLRGIRRVNDHTLIIQKHENSSLPALAEILQML